MSRNTVFKPLSKISPPLEQHGKGCCSNAKTFCLLLSFHKILKSIWYLNFGFGRNLGCRRRWRKNRRRKCAQHYMALKSTLHMIFPVSSNSIIRKSTIHTMKRCTKLTSANSTISPVELFWPRSQVNKNFVP